MHRAYNKRAAFHARVRANKNDKNIYISVILPGVLPFYRTLLGYSLIKNVDFTQMLLLKRVNDAILSPETENERYVELFLQEIPVLSRSRKKKLNIHCYWNAASSMALSSNLSFILIDRQVRFSRENLEENLTKRNVLRCISKHGNSFYV